MNNSTTKEMIYFTVSDSVDYTATYFTTLAELFPNSKLSQGWVHLSCLSWIRCTDDISFPLMELGLS